MSELDVRKIRKELGLNQTDFGKLVGVSLRAVQKWEAGHNNVSASAAKLIREIINKNEPNSHSLFAESLYPEKEKIPWLIPDEGVGEYNYHIVEDDSMSGDDKVVKKNDIVLLREVPRSGWDSLNYENYIFLFNHKTHKYIMRQVIEQNENSIKLHALNELYADVVMELDDFTQIFEVIDLKRRVSL